MTLIEEEIYKQCEEFESNFRYAINSNFVSMKASDFERVAALYTKVFGQPVRKSQMSCNTCRLQVLKKLGGAFYETRDYLLEVEKKKKEEEKKSEESEKKTSTEAPAKPKKKVGRPKKIDIE